MDNNVVITISASNKSGYLSSIMLNGRKAGLMFHNKKILENEGDILRLAITFEGHLNCSVSEFTQMIESHPEIHSVDNFLNKDTNSKVKDALIKNDPSLSAASNSKLNADDEITSEALILIENKLTDYLGPIAPLLVQSAKTSCFTIGELFASISKELEGDEKAGFLSLVDFKDTDYLKTINENKIKKQPKPKLIDTENEEDEDSDLILRTAVLYAHDIISPASLLIAENQLAKTLGPVAKIFIQSATEKTKHIGDLFLLLSEELEGSEKSDLLKLVKGLDLETV